MARYEELFVYFLNGASIGPVPWQDFSTGYSSSIGSGSIHNLAVDASQYIRLSSSSTAYLTGMLMNGDNSKYAGVPITIHNSGSYWIFVYPENANSTATNRFVTHGPGTLTYQGLYPGESITVIYDATSSRWRIVGVSGVIGQEATVLDPYNDVFLIGDQNNSWANRRSGNLNESLSQFSDGGGFALDQTTSDYVLVYDNSASQWKRVLLRDLILRLTADASPDSANDYVMTYDASASALKKVLLSNLGGAGTWTHGTLSQSMSYLSGTVTGNYSYNSTQKILRMSIAGSGSQTTTQSQMAFTLPASLTAGSYDQYFTGLYYDTTDGHFGAKIHITGTTCYIYPLGNGGTYVANHTNYFDFNTMWCRLN